MVIVIFLFFGLRDGVPLLRHDWGLPYNMAGWHSFAGAMTSGWSQNGIGQPRPYPTLYILGPLLASIGIALGSFWAVAAFLSAIAILMVAGTRKLALTFHAPGWVGLSLAVIALFNPWMYEELVAGHLTMMLSLAICLFTASSLIAGEASPVALFICGFVAAFQIQYGLLACVILFIIKPSRGVLFFTFVGAFVSLLPSIVGITLSHSFLSSIPFSTPWQLNNSVPLNEGVLLDGYSSNYTRSSSVFFTIAGAMLFLSSLMSLRVIRESPAVRMLVLRIWSGAIVVLLFCSGLRGPTAQLYLLLLSFRPILVFRELFDLIGIVALSYLVLTSLTAGRSRLGRLGAACASVLFLLAWLISPPFKYWVPASAVPSIRIHSRTPNLRFALMPWVQPLRLGTQGSGADPDIYTHANNFSSLNQYQFNYPVGEAIASYLRTGNAVALESLSVSHIYGRPYLASDRRTIANGDPADSRLPMTSSSKRLVPQPELELTNIPPSSDRVHRFETPYLLGNGDPADFLRRARPVEVSPGSMDPRKMWVAIAEASPGFSGIGNPFGGAFTTGNRSRLIVPIPRPMAALVRVRGELLGGRRVLSSNTQGWAWVGLRGARSLRCRGRCAVALWQMRRLPTIINSFESGVRAVNVPFGQFVPYAITGHIHLDSPTSHRSILLFRSRYDPAWVLLGIRSLRHVDYSMVFNGYELPRGFAGGSFVILNTTAAFQAAAMILSLLFFVAGICKLPNRRLSDYRSE